MLVKENRTLVTMHFYEKSRPSQSAIAYNILILYVWCLRSKKCIIRFFWKKLKCEIAKGLFWRYNPLDPPRCRAILPSSSPAPRLDLCMLALLFIGVSESKIHQYTNMEAIILYIYFYPTHQSWPYHQSISDFRLVTVKNVIVTIKRQFHSKRPLSLVVRGHIWQWHLSTFPFPLIFKSISNRFCQV